MTPPRKPAAFRIAAEKPAPAPHPAAPSAQPTPPAARPPAAQASVKQRPPRALKSEDALVVPDEADFFAEPVAVAGDPPPATAPRRRSWLAPIFAGAFGILVSLAIGLWTDRLIRDLFARTEWLGWVAAAAAAVALLALIVILTREMLALAKLSSIERLRADAAEAARKDDAKAARKVVAELTALLAANPETAAGRKALADLDGEIIDGANLIRLAETEILGPLDARAKTLVLDAAKRVSIVTAVSPRALVDLAYVVFEAGRLIRRLSELYGGRPGTLGFLRLARSVVAHLAVTGAIAAGDDFVHQIVGQGLAARLSAKLGEGVVNGTMTARIGIAAMETVRPLPFAALKRPKLTDFLAALASFTNRKAAGKDAPAA
ncbi:TIGR01620 family protein [Mesorhizobium sp. LHD-90]|uniref:YcjF family protein n=1 Tax=Mesorhizobium sp. LHD-90 TaxID=3071414 RepID=UPI0027E05F13|nr:TIGR01620 family protein [Mesorhizobium sp. LHD-90]MDQ6437842.1 TIGR01620 family protein [Mesorhizobium sp. LHD-90]